MGFHPAQASGRAASPGPACRTHITACRTHRYPLRDSLGDTPVGVFPGIGKKKTASPQHPPCASVCESAMDVRTLCVCHGRGVRCCRIDGRGGRPSLYRTAGWGLGSVGACGPGAPRPPLCAVRSYSHLKALTPFSPLPARLDPTRASARLCACLPHGRAISDSPSPGICDSKLR